MKYKKPKIVAEIGCNHAGSLDLAKKLIDVIAEKTIEYLSGQIDAGAEVIQLFDSWSGMLNETQYDEFVINPTIKISSLNSIKL